MNKLTKTLFYVGLGGLVIFEILNVYFIMPMPGSQRLDSLDVAYFLYTSRWVIRAICLAMVVLGSVAAFGNKRKWLPALMLIVAIAVAYLFNFRMSADHMFLQPRNVLLKSKSENTLPGERLVIGVERNGEARAYPINFLTYHHQVLDSVGGKPVMVTYCSVCRTGRVYEPIVNGQHEKFRLVGMDHFNAMFEDASTKSWWYQATGEAIAGKLKGETLPEVNSVQMSIDKWFELYPHGKVMQPDTTFTAEYDSLANFEQGKSKGRLTRTDSLPWRDKSWVIGVVIDNYSKAYDWNEFVRERIINDRIGQTPIVLAVSSDSLSFVVFERPSSNPFTLRDDDILMADSLSFDFSGRNLTSPSDRLKKIQAYQEFWHSWRTFHPETRR